MESWSFKERIVVRRVLRRLRADAQLVADAKVETFINATARQWGIELDAPKAAEDDVTRARMPGKIIRPRVGR